MIKQQKSKPKFDEISINMVPKLQAHSQSSINRREENKKRLRGSIKRKHTDRIFRWLNVGCGSCFLHESSGRAKEIGPPKNQDYETQFPMQLQKAMFLYYIDCRVPFSDDIISADKQCPICKQLMVDPATTGNDDCRHLFCKLCIQQWCFVANEKSSNAFNINLASKQGKCPICQRKINMKKIKIIEKKRKEMKSGIPTTIYQQIMEENQSRYARQHLQNKYLAERERVLQAEQQERPLMDQFDANPIAHLSKLISDS